MNTSGKRRKEGAKLKEMAPVCPGSETPDSGVAEQSFDFSPDSPTFRECKRQLQMSDPGSSTPIGTSQQPDISCSFSSSTSSRSYSRYDSGLGRSICEDTSVLELFSGTILEDLVDPFSDSEDEDPDIISPIGSVPDIEVSADTISPLLSSYPVNEIPANTYTLTPPTDEFHRGPNGSLTPASFQRLRTYSEGDNELFDHNFHHGPLSDPELTCDVISARLVNIARDLDMNVFSSEPAAGVTPDNEYLNQDYLMDEISDRLRQLGHRIDREHFTSRYSQLMSPQIIGLSVVVFAVSIMCFRSS